MSVPQEHEGCVFHIQIKDNLPLIELALNGVIHPITLVNAYHQVVALARKHNLQTLLVDSSRLKLDIDAVEIYELVEQVAMMLDDMVVARVIDPNQFGFYLVEQQLQKYDVTVKSFECYEEAQDWLLSTAHALN